MKKAIKTSKAQLEANKRQDEKRKSDPRLPGTRLSKEDGVIMDKLYSLFDSKSEAIIEASKFYLKSIKKK